MTADEYTPPTEMELLQEIHDAIMHPDTLFPGQRRPPYPGPFVAGHRVVEPLRLCANQTMYWTIEVVALTDDRIEYYFSDPFGSRSRKFTAKVYAYG